jgi:SAM-dependent methyltransferase
VTSPVRSEDKVWYNRFYGEPSDRDVIVPRRIVERYRRPLHPELFHLERWHQLVGDVRGKKVLYIGCGVESSVILLALRGAQVCALDLAFEALREQRHMAGANGTRDRTRLVVASCTQLPFANDSFDLVVGIGILHHLQEDLDTPCAEVSRILKPQGFAVFEEPIMRSGILKRLRTYVPVPPPRDASPQCRPLEGEALNHFARYFEADTYSFGLFSRLERLILGGVPLEFAPWWRTGTVYGLHYLDYLLFQIRGFERFAGVVVLKLSRRFT